jgi:hypothetical protein
MWEDPIVAEVHRTREELAAKFNFDVKAIVADIRERQAALGSRLVSLAKPAEAATGRKCQPLLDAPPTS